MCGIFGVIGTPDASEEAYYGLIALQHRGQDACGILSYDQTFHMEKGMGYVSNFFDTDKLNRLTGKIAIGHVRYPTVGSTRVRDAQPFFIDFCGGIGMAHNGNIPNYDLIKRKLTNELNWYVNSSCDAEVILKFFVQELKPNYEVDDIFKSVGNVFDNILPSYSVVMVVADKGLLAFRDPLGIRPLIFGKKVEDGKTSYAFCSESVALINLGYEIERDVLPGEALFIDKGLNISSKMVKEHPHKHCMFEWIYFARPESVMEKCPIYTVRENLGRELAKELKNIEADVVMPVPDTSRTAAIALAEELKLPYREGVIKNRYIGRSFIMNSQQKREIAVKLKLSPVSTNIKDKRLIMVDDSIVRGTTSKRIINMLRKAGAKEIHMVSTCPPIKAPCFWGVDFPLSEELVANEKTNDQIKDTIGADSVTYISLEAMRKAIGLDDLCECCLGCSAPTCTESAKEFGEQRKIDREKETKCS